MNKKKKRHYRVNEYVWFIDLKKPVRVVSINKGDLEITVADEHGDGSVTEYTVPFWNVDVLKYNAKRKMKAEVEEIKFAKIHEDATIPKKARDTEAGYDVWTRLNPDKNGVREILLKKHVPNIVPTGIAVVTDKKYYTNFANERGSTGSLGIGILSGIVDSSFRGGVSLIIMPLYKDVLITSETDDIEELDDIILYPYTKAICQMIPYEVPSLKDKEITFDELKNIPSERGDGKFGSTGH